MARRPSRSRKSESLAGRVSRDFGYRKERVGRRGGAYTRGMDRLEASSFQIDERMRRHLAGLAAERGISVQELLESAFGRPGEPDLAELEEQRRRLYDFLLAEYRANVDPRGTRADWERWLAEGTPAAEIPADAERR